MPLLAAYIVPHPPLIVKEVGRGQEQRIIKTIDSFQEIAKRIAVLKPQTIIISSPHSNLLRDYFVLASGSGAIGTLKNFGAPDVKFQVQYDQSLVNLITSIAKKENLHAGLGPVGANAKELDHGVMIPLYFINQQYVDYQVVQISLTDLNPIEHYRLGKCISQAILESGKRVVYLASGDLSHKLKEDGPYGFAKEGPEFDELVTNAMKSGDFKTFLTLDDELSQEAGECGLRSFQIMAGLFDGIQVESELLSYEGPFGVGYAIASFVPLNENNQRHYDQQIITKEVDRLLDIKKSEDPYTSLARQSLECFLKTHLPLSKPTGLPLEMKEKRAGVFVSLKKEGRLRGCIGTIAPSTFSIADEIIQNAVSAGVDDPRFAPVTLDELPFLTYSVDVLGKPERISSLTQLDVKRYGVIVSFRSKRGLLLPDIAGVETPKKQVEIALQKAGIAKDIKYSLERFEVIRHK